MILRKIFVIDIMFPGIVLVPPSVCNLWLKMRRSSFQSLMVTWHALKLDEYLKKCLTIRFIRIIHAQIYKPSSWVDIQRHFQLKNSFSFSLKTVSVLKLFFNWKCLRISTHELGLKNWAWMILINRIVRHFFKYSATLRACQVTISDWKLPQPTFSHKWHTEGGTRTISGHMMSSTNIFLRIIQA